jgi:hypothetical protein
MKTKIVLSLVCFSLFAACGDDDLPKSTDLGGLRILAIQAGSDGAAAEYAEGQTVQLTPYISDYNQTRTVEFEAMWCLDPGVSYGAQPSCEGVPGATSLGNGAITFGDPNRTGAANPLPASFQIPAGLLATRLPTDQFNGVAVLFTYKLRASDGATTKSFKRVIVSNKPAKNNNPPAPAIQVAGAPLSAYPAGPVQVSASVAPSANEAFQEMKRDGSLTGRTEELLTSWFISDGTLELFRTINGQATKFEPPATKPTGRTPIIVAVTRDSRGGVAVRVQPLP